MDNKFLSNFKMGISDALFSGNMRSSYDQTQGGYKQGYDFGITLYSDLNEYHERGY